VVRFSEAGFSKSCAKCSCPQGSPALIEACRSSSRAWWGRKQARRRLSVASSQVDSGGLEWAKPASVKAAATSGPLALAEFQDLRILGSASTHSRGRRPRLLEPLPLGSTASRAGPGRYLGRGSDRFGGALALATATGEWAAGVSRGPNYQPEAHPRLLSRFAKRHEQQTPDHSWAGARPWTEAGSSWRVEGIGARWAITRSADALLREFAARKRSSHCANSVRRRQCFSTVIHRGSITEQQQVSPGPRAGASISTVAV